MNVAHQDDSAVRIVDSLLKLAIERNASDLHLEPTEFELRVRLRIDGYLTDQMPINKLHLNQVISRVKVLGRINIAEKRVPQDGKFRMTINNTVIDMRVSTFPGIFGEKVVVRVLDRTAHCLTLDQLGFASATLNQFLDLIQKPTGLLLVTGPTGSGKTTTLYAALSHLHRPDRNIITLEDPVEYHLQGITQGQINVEAGFSFECGIRSLLRQDPDILMVGEIRDRQTAHTAIEAAMTGHLVLSTLHTNDAPSAIMRLMDMGIDPYLINASLLGVLAQRLVRKICDYCAIPATKNVPVIPAWSIAPELLKTGAGCERCNQVGFKGRIGIFELLTVSSSLRALMVQQPQHSVIVQQAISDGMQTLLQDGIEKVRAGRISLAELVRVIN